MEPSALTYRVPKKILSFVFIALTTWWVVLFFEFKGMFPFENLKWAAVYQVAALIGAIMGVYISGSWGGLKSLIGRAILMFSIGLLLQNFGQTVFSVYNLVLKVEIPYPSIADIGFFGSVPFYIYGSYLVGQLCGAKFSLKSFHARAIAILLPLALLTLSYLLFLKGYVFDYSSPIRIILDLGYPLGQAVYISFALLAFIFAKDSLGGVMKNTVLLLLAALCVQYVADFNFLYQAGNQTWINGGYGDYLYLISYTLLASALIKFGTTFSKIRSTQ